MVPVTSRQRLNTFDALNRRKRRARRDAWWRDGLEAAAWLVAVASVAFFLASGAMVWAVGSDALNALGRFVGIVATVLMLVQVLLASRAPFIEGALGHDKALKLHGSMGQPIFLLLVAHAALITIGYGAPMGRDIVSQTAWFMSHTGTIALSVVALAMFVMVAVTSVAAARRRWPYETWHAIHLFAYAAIALSVPHQFIDGRTFANGGAAWVFWAALYVVAFGSMLIWRFAVPAYRAIHHRLVVVDVEHHADGSASLTMTGRHLDDWYARSGQFFLVRLWTRDLWLTAHPYSLSAAPDGRSLRFTVKPLGDDSAKSVEVRPGTRASASGPYGRFTHDARVRRGLVLMGAGVGVTPLRSMLEDRQASDGACDVIIRGGGPDAVPLLDEFRELAAARGARLHVILGRRGDGWSTLDGPSSLSQIVPDLEDCDLFVCGSEGWAKAVIADARRSGVAEEAIHVEEYAW